MNEIYPFEYCIVVMRHYACKDQLKVLGHELSISRILGISTWYLEADIIRDVVGT